MHDLLQDPLIEVRGLMGEQRLALPALISGLLRGEVLECTGLRPHQADPWHVFLVQIAASVMARHPDLDDPPAEPSFWRDELLSLADGMSSAWELVVDDVTRPAFLQHPLTEAGDLSAFKPKEPKARAPDELDVLVTAKDHDVKMARMRADDPQAWLFALVSYQTTSGYLGAGNFGIVRMNGGFASRSIVSLVSDRRPGPRFREELQTVVGMRESALSSGLGYSARGVTLTWLRAWNRGASQYQLSDLEPWFIEAPRPTRLARTERGIVALGSTSDARQVGPKSLDGGDVADPWTAINVADKKKGRSALTVAQPGWSPELIAKLLFQNQFETTLLQRPRPGMTGTAWLIGSVLVRGQGTTEGFHRFSVPVPASVRPRLLRSDERALLGKTAESFIADARAAEGALRSALAAYAEGGPDSVDFGRDTIMRWVKVAAESYSHIWADAFFPALWRLADENEERVTEAWRTSLVSHARTTLESAQDGLPVPRARHYRAIVGAQRVLEGALRKKGLIESTTRQAAV